MYFKPNLYQPSKVLHSASLVHDDMLDGSDVRRGEAPL